MKNFNEIIRTIDLRVIKELIKKTELKADYYFNSFNKQEFIGFVKNIYDLYESKLIGQFKDIGLKRFIKITKYINSLNDYKKILNEIRKFELFMKILTEYSIDYEK